MQGVTTDLHVYMIEYIENLNSWLGIQKCLIFVVICHLFQSLVVFLKYWNSFFLKKKIT